MRPVINLVAASNAAARESVAKAGVPQPRRRPSQGAKRPRTEAAPRCYELRVATLTAASFCVKDNEAVSVTPSLELQWRYLCLLRHRLTSEAKSNISGNRYMQGRMAHCSNCDLDCMSFFVWR